jgi:FkbH-like protein
MSPQGLFSRKKACEQDFSGSGSPVNFLEARRLANSFGGGPVLQFLFGVSGGAEKLDVFFRAAAAKRGRSVQIRTLPFNTLGQSLLAEPMPGELEIFLLFPWDFVPEADWRSGLPTTALDLAALHERAQTLANRIDRRRMARMLYVPAPFPPLFADPATTANLETWLATLASAHGAELLSPEVFSLASYLSTGSPFAGTQLGDVAQRVVDRALGPATGPAKVLITDLDNVLWNGVIGEDGIDGIRYSPEGVGFRHFLYQTFLAKLKREGTLLAAVSRNDPDLAYAPLRSGRMTLRAEDLVVVVASYNAKSSQIREIAKQLNLGLDSFVFVDDNPIEIEEVSSALPEVRTVTFPAKDDGLPAFFAELSALFSRSVVTAEDAERTEMYRRRFDGMLPDTGEGADLTGFLRGLEMSLSIHDRSRGDRVRAVQLINKTNQFNLNGRRVSEDDVGAMLAAGGRLYGATLSDRTGSHGEVLACLMDAGGVVRSLVMSCRVFQRRMEYAFLSWLGGVENAPTALDFAFTPRNEPMRRFLEDPTFRPGTDGMLAIDLAEFRRTHVDDLALFAVVPPAGIPASTTR